jgi:hypothetical protein
VTPSWFIVVALRLLDHALSYYVLHACDGRFVLVRLGRIIGVLYRPRLRRHSDWRCVEADREPQKTDNYDSLVKATGRSLLHLESVDGHLGVVRVRTRLDRWRRNFARTSTGFGGRIYLRGRYSFGRSFRR